MEKIVGIFVILTGIGLGGLMVTFGMGFILGLFK